MYEAVLQLYYLLIERCPVDTGNMRTNIYLYDYGDYYKLSIETYYASYVNYNRQRTPKEQANYHWVEDTVKEWSLTTGGNIEYDIS